MAELRFPEPPLADDVVLLRPWVEDDLSSRAAAFADPLLDRFSNPLTTGVTDADVRANFGRQGQARLRGEQIDFALAVPSGPTLAGGGASLYDVDLEQGRAAVGFWLTPAFRGRGIATHATRLLAGWAFGGLGVARLELTCAPDNEASQRVALRCGFVLEGILRSHTLFKGTRRDTMVFSLLASDLA